MRAKIFTIFAVVFSMATALTNTGCKQKGNQGSAEQGFTDTSFVFKESDLENASLDTVNVSQIQHSDSLALRLVLTKSVSKPIPRISFSKLTGEIQAMQRIAVAPVAERVAMLEDFDEEPAGVTRADVLEKILESLPKCKRVIRRPGVIKIHLEGFDFILKGQKVVGVGKLDISPQLLPAITQTYALLDQYQFNNCQNLNTLIMNGIVSGRGASDVLLTNFLTKNQTIWENIMTLSQAIRDANSQPSIDVSVTNAVVRSNESLNRLEGSTPTSTSSTTPVSTSTVTTTVSSGTQQ